jgi:hypothetical protein
MCYKMFVKVAIMTCTTGENGPNSWPKMGVQ